LEANLTSKQRTRCRVLLGRIEGLRESGAPRWVIKTEQINLALARQNTTPYVNRDKTIALIARHVQPLMDGAISSPRR
jgi:hypothetical protein